MDNPKRVNKTQKQIVWEYVKSAPHAVAVRDVAFGTRDLIPSAPDDPAERRARVSTILFQLYRDGYLIRNKQPTDDGILAFYYSAAPGRVYSSPASRRNPFLYYFVDDECGVAIDGTSLKIVQDYLRGRENTTVAEASGALEGRLSRKQVANAMNIHNIKKGYLKRRDEHGNPDVDNFKKTNQDKRYFERDYFSNNDRIYYVLKYAPRDMTEKEIIAKILSTDYEDFSNIRGGTINTQINRLRKLKCVKRARKDGEWYYHLTTRGDREIPEMGLSNGVGRTQPIPPALINVLCADVNAPTQTVLPVTEGAGVKLPRSDDADKETHLNHMIDVLTENDVNAFDVCYKCILMEHAKFKNNEIQKRREQIEALEAEIDSLEFAV